MTRLREVVSAQQRQLDAQGKQLDELRALLLEQGQAIEALRQPAPVSPVTARAMPSPTAAFSPVPSILTSAPERSPSPSGTAQATPQGVNATQEIAEEVPTGSALELGPAQVRLGGYLALTGTFRSTNSGGNVGTSFATTPFGDTAQGNLSEARLSAQSTRLSLRVDAPMATGKLAGYFEMDFAGSTPGTVAVSSSSVGFRLRQAFGEITANRTLILAAGQAFSLMTPAKAQLSIWPSDYQLSQAVDTNYIAGLVWSRQPQLRLTWRPSTRFNWAVSAENPEQQVGKDRIVWPACCTNDLDAQYNTGGDELRVPNLMPDIATRVAVNAGDTFHADVGGVLRVFRHTLAPYQHRHTSPGGGVSANLGLKAGKATTLVGEGSWGAGMGRYLGGLVPDVVVRADGSIEPVRSTSWVGGVEHRVSPRVVLAGYYSGLYTASSVALDADGTFIGFGFPGSADTNNRVVQEATGVVTWQTMKTTNRGSLQWNAQTSWLTRSPWSRGGGPASADAFLFLTQIRYNLP